MIIDMAIPGHTRVWDKEREKYSLLKDVIMANEKGCCDSHCSQRIRNYNNKVSEVYWKPWNWDQIKHVQKLALLGKARIIRKVLSC